MGNLIPGLLAGVATFVLALLVMSPALRLAHKYELVDRPGQHKRHRRIVPIVGGLVMFPCIWIAVGVSVFIAPETFVELSGSFGYILAGGAIMFLVGSSDDLVPLSAWTKLVAQIAAGFVVYLGGLGINPISVPFVGSFDIGGWSALVTIVWVVGLTNAINFIDGLDGLASGVSLIAALTIGVIGSLYGVSTVILLSSALTGFLLVFLWYNRHPARAFLGDSGSLQIGYFFAVMSLLVPLKSFTAAALYLPLLSLGVPLMEIVISISRRLATGKNIMQADRRHLFHYLSLTGLSSRAVVYLFWMLSAVFGLFALAMYFWDRLIVFGILVLFMVVISALFFIFMADLSRPGSRRKTGPGQDAGD